jgi:hypothetical protein
MGKLLAAAYAGLATIESMMEPGAAKMRPRFVRHVAKVIDKPKAGT